MGKYWSSDAVAKDVSSSQYGTLVSFAESPVLEGLLFTGSDDGVIAISEDKGANWSKISSFPDVPEYTYVSDVCPSRFDENIVYASFNNLKSNDFKPYIAISKNKGKTWTAISSNLPEGSIHTIAQDFKDPNMLFCGTEFGLFVSFNEGSEWIQVKNGLPDIAVRDIVIQEQESDLVLATFGRGFYILPNYHALREINNIDANSNAHIFSVKDAKLFVPRYQRRSSFGDDFYMVENLPFGAEFTYYLKETVETEKDKRQKKDSELFEEGAKIKVNTWEEDRLEKLEENPYLIFVIEDTEGNTIRKITSKATEGINRVYWDLKYPDLAPVNPDIKEFDPLKKQEGGIYVMPGTYALTMYSSKSGKLTQIADKTSFEVTALKNTNFGDEGREATLSFQKTIAKLTHTIMTTEQDIIRSKNEIQRLKQANINSVDFDMEINNSLIELEHKNANLMLALTGYEAKASYEEVSPAAVPIQQRLSFVIYSFINSSEPVSEAQKQSADIITQEFESFLLDLNTHKIEVEKLKNLLN